MALMAQKDKPWVYISGPMRGVTDFNYPAFNAAEEDLTRRGYQVLNPARSFAGDTSRAWEDYMRADIKSLLQVDKVYVLPGWEQSSGVKVELTVAVALGLPIVRYLPAVAGEHLDVRYLVQPGVDAPEFSKSTEQENALQTANRLVYGNRQKDYGHPYDDFSKTAGFWSVLFGVPVEPWQVPMAQWLLKTSRLMNSPTHADSVVDVAGYAGTYELTMQRVAELEKEQAIA